MTESHGSRPALHRVLGLTEVTAGGVGIIIGAGIYVLLGAATALAGPVVWLAFLLAAVLSLLTGLSYAELSSMFPSAAGEYEYTRQALPEWVAFVVGWTMIVGLIVAAATVAIGFGRYVGYFVDLNAGVAAVGLVMLVSVVALSGIKQSARLALTMSAVQVGGLVLVLLIGVPHVGDVDILTGHVGGVLGAAALVFFAFIGFDEVITLAEETGDPTRTVPRALLLALGLSTVLYVAVAIAAVSVLGAQALAASPRPLADVMAHVLGDRGASVVAATAVVTTKRTPGLPDLEGSTSSRLTAGNPSVSVSGRAKGYVGSSGTASGDSRAASLNNERLTASRPLTTLHPLMSRRAPSIFLVAVAILMVMGHICAGPLHAHAGSVTTHTEDHHEHGSDDAAHGGSCEALRATPSVDLPALPAVRLDVALVTAILTATAAPRPAPDASPPLFLLHAVLLI